MTAYYRARIRVGPYHWDIEQGDPWAYGPMDGLKITSGLPDGKSWPCQPEPTRLDFQVLVAAAADFDRVDVGSLVTVILHYAPTVDLSQKVLGMFFGRVADITADTDPDGMLYTLVAYDHTVQLNARQAGDLGQLPANFQDMTTAVDAWWADAGLPSPWYFVTPPAGYRIRGLNDDVRPVLDMTTEALESYVHQAVLGDSWFQRGTVIPNVVINLAAGSHTLDKAQPFRIFFRRNRVATVMPNGWLPARLRNLDGTYRPVIDTEDTNLPDASPGNPKTQPALDASMVDFGARWNRNRAHAYDVVEIPYTTSTTGKAKVYRLANTNDPVPVTQVLAGARVVNDGTNLRDVALFNLPDPGDRLRYQVDKFRVYASDDPEAFTNSGGYRVWTYPEYLIVAPVLAIGGIPAAQNPNPGHQAYYGGMVRHVELVIQDGDYYADVVMDPVVPRAIVPSPDDPAQRGYLCKQSATATQKAVTWAQLEDTFTHYDMRLVRRNF